MGAAPAQQLPGIPDSSADGCLRHAVLPAHPALRPPGSEKPLPSSHYSRVVFRDAALNSRSVASAPGAAHALRPQLAPHLRMRSPAPVNRHRNCFQMRGLDAVLMAATTRPDVIDVVTIGNWLVIVGQLPGHAMSQTSRTEPVNLAIARLFMDMQRPEQAAGTVFGVRTMRPETLCRICNSVPSRRAALPASSGALCALLSRKVLTALIFSVRDRLKVLGLNALCMTAAFILHMVHLVASWNRADREQVRNPVRALGFSVPPHLTVTGVADNAGPQQAAGTVRSALGLRPEPVGIRQRAARIFQAADFGQPLVVLAAVAQCLVQTLTARDFAVWPNSSLPVPTRDHRRERAASAALVVAAIAKAASCTRGCAAVGACTHVPSLFHFRSEYNV